MKKRLQLRFLVLFLMGFAFGNQSALQAAKDPIKPEQASSKEASTSPSAETADKCSICLEEMTAERNPATLTCNHTYCKECIDDWLEKNKTCPFCRKEFGSEDPFKSTSTQESQKTKTQSPNRSMVLADSKSDTATTPQYNPDENLYRILGISPSAPISEATVAYRRLARIHHPDKGGNEEVFKKIKDAYEILSDPEKRAAYNNALTDQSAPAKPLAIEYFDAKKPTVPEKKKVPPAAPSQPLMSQETASKVVDYSIDFFKKAGEKVRNYFQEKHEQKKEAQAAEKEAIKQAAEKAKEADDTIKHGASDASQSSEQPKKIDEKKEIAPVANEKEEKKEEKIDAIQAPDKAEKETPKKSSEDQEDAQEECSICIDTMTPEATAQQSCGHSFHRECIDEWLKNHTTCPLCRAEIKQEEKAATKKQSQRRRKESRHKKNTQRRRKKKKAHKKKKVHSYLEKNKQKIARRKRQERIARRALRRGEKNKKDQAEKPSAGKNRPAAAQKSCPLAQAQCKASDGSCPMHAGKKIACPLAKKACSGKACPLHKVKKIVESVRSADEQSESDSEKVLE